MDLTTLSAKKKLYLKANKAYHDGGNPIMTDAQFDKLEKEIARADPTWNRLKKTGSTVNKKVSVALLEPMPSLNKCYPETIDKWLAKRREKKLLALHKLDGSALQGHYRKGRCVFLATRGDGKTGKDISFLIPHLRHSLPIIADESDVVIRFEAVISLEKFKKWARKTADDKDKFDNPRNMVNGLLNRREAHPAMRDIDILVLGVYGNPMEAGLKWAHDQGLKIAPYDLVTPEADFTKRLLRARAASEYDIDGLVLVAPNQVFGYDSYEKPKWTTAFKVNDDDGAVEVTVLEIIEQVSRNDRISPKIKITPTKIKGVEVTYATAHNAQWMADRGIGVGAVVKLVRSGDVIPKIEAVVKKAKKPWVPSIPYKQVGAHFVATQRHKEADVREIHHFMTVLGIENIARKSIAKLYDAGFTSVLSHLESFGQRMRGYTDAGIGEAMTGKIYNEFNRVLHDDGVTLLQLMHASNCFESFGERKLQMIEQHFMKKGDRDPLKGFVKQPIVPLSKITAIKGMGEVSADQFLQGLERFKKWFRPILKTRLIKINDPQLVQKKKAVNGDLAGQRVSFTSYRDAAHEATVEARGAEVVPYSAKTTILLFKKGGKASSKIEAARAKGIRVCTFEEL
jgi:NAD-dependent DNA ligase